MITFCSLFWSVFIFTLVCLETAKGRCKSSGGRFMDLMCMFVVIWSIVSQSQIYFSVDNLSFNKNYQDISIVWNVRENDGNLKQFLPISRDLEEVDQNCKTKYKLDRRNFLKDSCFTLEFIARPIFAFPSAVSHFYPPSILHYPRNLSTPVLPPLSIPTMHLCHSFSLALWFSTCLFFSVHVVLSLCVCCVCVWEWKGNL